MKKQEQEKLVTDFLSAMTDSILNKLKDVPEEWDGFELRHWIANKFNHEDLFQNKVWMMLNPNYKRRKKECENDIIINNL